MDVRPRGTLLTSSAGFLFASIGFTLSVLSTLLRLLWPFYGTRGTADTDTALSALRRAHSKRKSRRKSAAPSISTSTNPSIASTSSSEGSSSSSPPPRVTRRHPAPLKPTRRGRSRSLERAVHSRNASERLGRAGLRVPSQERQRSGGRKRSESTPPTPSPRQWSFSEAQTTLKVPGQDSDSAPQSRRSSLHIERRLLMDLSHGHLSFLHLPHLPKKLHRSASIISTETAHPEVSHSEKRHSGSHLIKDLLHKRRSIDSRRFSGMSYNADEEDSSSPSASSPDAPEDHHAHRRSIDSTIEHYPAPKRSQTLRTRPYEAPYFFPQPGSVQAE